MNIDSNTLTRTAAAIAALDLSTYEDKLSGLQASLDAANEADERTSARITDIDHEIRAFRTIDSAAIADELIAGVDTVEAVKVAKSVADLEAEREKLLPALRDIRHKAEDLRSEMEKTRSEAAHSLSTVLAPLTDAVIAEAKAAGESLIAAYAALAAINNTTAGFMSEVHRAARMVEAAEKHLLERLPSSFPVPGEVIAVLHNLQGKSRAVRTIVIERVPCPNLPNEHAHLLAVAASRAA